LKKGQSAFRRKGDIMVQMISTIHGTTNVNTGRKDRKKTLEVKEPSCVQYSKFMKGIDKADHYLSYYPVLSKNCQIVEKDGNVSAKLDTLQCFCCVQNTKHKQKRKVQELPAHGTKVLHIRTQNRTKSSSDHLQLPEKQAIPRGPKQNPPA